MGKQRYMRDGSRSCGHVSRGGGSTAAEAWRMNARDLLCLRGTGRYWRRRTGEVEKKEEEASEARWIIDRTVE
jgi:hypothetical protein